MQSPLGAVVMWGPLPASGLHSSTANPVSSDPEMTWGEKHFPGGQSAALLISPLPWRGAWSWLAPGPARTGETVP